MLCFITYNMLLYNICYLMLYNIKYVMSYNMCPVMLYNIRYVMLYNIKYVMLCYNILYCISFQCSCKNSVLFALLHII